MRALLFKGAVGLVEDLRAEAAGTRPPQEDFSPAFQVCFPYVGAFVWHVAGDSVFGDANQLLYVRAGEAFRVTPAVPASYGELIVTPVPAVLAELLQTPERQLASHPLFAERRRCADARVQRTRAEFLNAFAGPASPDPAACEEATILLLRAALCVDACCPTGGPGTARMIARAKEFLAANFTQALRLDEIARHAGASPAYLTTAFRRSEGIPVHRYVTRLRLSRALIELPHATDLTQLALALGFSSHSHFSFAFRKTFGCTPSAFRNSTGVTVRR